MTSILEQKAKTKEQLNNRNKKIKRTDGVRYCKVWREGQDSVPGTSRRSQRNLPSGHDELNALPPRSADPAG